MVDFDAPSGTQIAPARWKGADWSEAGLAARRSCFITLWVLIVSVLVVEGIRGGENG